MKGYDFYIDSRGYLFINGTCFGKFSEMQERIISERMDLVQLFKIKSILNRKDMSIRYIADWESIVYFYFNDKLKTNEE
jgi:hypothetical protein